MGCGDVCKKELIQGKDIDLYTTSPHFKESSEILSLDRIKKCDIVERKRTIKKANKNKVDKKNNINKNNNQFSVNINKGEKIYNGPIINMLKRQVDNLRKN